MSSMSLDPSRCFASNAEERWKLLDSPEKDSEEHAGFLQSPEKEVFVAKSFQGSDEMVDASMSLCGAPSRSEAPLVDVGQQEFADPLCVEGHAAIQLHESPQADPECRFPDVSVSDSHGPAEKLLQNLAEFTKMQITGSALSVEFQMMLQLLECSAQQQKLLHQVNDRVEYMHSDLEQRLDQFQCNLPDMKCNRLTEHTTNDTAAPQARQDEACDDVVHDLQLVHQKEARGALVQREHNTNGPALQVGELEKAHATHCDSASNDTELQLGPSKVTKQEAQEESPEASASVHDSADAEGSGRKPRVSTESADTMIHADTMFGHIISTRKACVATAVAEDGIRKSEFGVLDNLGNMATVLEQDSKHKSQDSLLSKLVGHHCFDLACAFIISTNAVTIGIQVQQDVNFALSNTRDVPTVMPRSPIMTIVEKLYIAFYSLELVLKLSVWRCGFFKGENQAWNIFDMILVIAGIYDLIMELTPLRSIFSGDFGLTWLRFMRILKMLKLLRVVRVMRFFHHLRLMVTSIASSMGTLLWSVLMLSMIMYTFGLCFLMAVSTHLTQEDLHITVDGDWDETREGIGAYWSSVIQAMISLYFAITGGADWEQLAAPILTSDPLFYAVFCVYIMFMTVAVLNVLTGIFVDQAMKVASEDMENVMKEVMSKPEVHEFRDFVKVLCNEMDADVKKLLQTDESEEEHGDDEVVLTWAMLQQHLHSDIVSNFFSALEITEEDGKRVFGMLDPEKLDEVGLEDFIIGCLSAKGNSLSMNVVFLVSETKRLAQQLSVSMAYMEDRFDELYEGMNASGSMAQKESRLSLRSKLNIAQCGPANNVVHNERKQWQSFRRMTQRQSLRTAVKRASQMHQ